MTALSIALKNNTTIRNYLGLHNQAVAQGAVGSSNCATALRFLSHRLAAPGTRTVGLRAKKLTKYKIKSIPKSLMIDATSAAVVFVNSCTGINAYTGYSYNLVNWKSGEYSNEVEAFLDRSRFDLEFKIREKIKMIDSLENEAVGAKKKALKKLVREISVLQAELTINILHLKEVVAQLEENYDFVSWYGAFDGIVAPEKTGDDETASSEAVPLDAALAEADAEKRKLSDSEELRQLEQFKETFASAELINEVIKKSTDDDVEVNIDSYITAALNRTGISDPSPLLLKAISVIRSMASMKLDDAGDQALIPEASDHQERLSAPVEVEPCAVFVETSAGAETAAAVETPASEKSTTAMEAALKGAIQGRQDSKKPKR